MDSVVWQRPSKCGTSQCVEVAFVDGDTIQVRNSADPGVVLTYTRAEWDAFVAGAKNGEFRF